MLRHNTIAIVSGILAVIFTIYIAMDTFMVSHVYQVVETSQDSIEDLPDETEHLPAQVEVSGTAYRDENIQIILTDYRENNTDIYVTDITLSSPEYLKTAFAKSCYGKNVVEKTSVIAQENQAILAINGDYYGVQENGYVIRNGVIYRSTSKGDQEDLAIYKDGTMKIVNEQDITAEELLENGVWNLLCFGPGLIVNKEVSVSESDEVDKARTSNPRTAVGMIDPLHYVFVVADGRTNESEGLSLYELAQFMANLGVTDAYNLDGGGSSTLYFNGEIINHPVSGSGKKAGKKSGKTGAGESGTMERSVSDIVYIGY